MSTNDIDDRLVPLADICAQLRTKSGQEILTENVSLPIKVAGAWSCITMPTWTFEALETIGQARAAMKSAHDVEEYTCGNCGGQFRADKRTSCACHTSPVELPTPDVSASIAAAAADHTTKQVDREMTERPTPLSNRMKDHLHVQFPATVGHIPLMAMLAQVADLERQLAEAREIIDAAKRPVDQAVVMRLIEERNEAREMIERQRKELVERIVEARELAGELIAMIRVNVMRDTFRESTIEQVDAHLEPWIKRLDAVKETSNTPDHPPR